MTRQLRTLLGDYPMTAALKSGHIGSDLVTLDFANVKVPNTAFKRVVRSLEFDMAELAIATFLIARSQGLPLTLLPIALTARFQHPFLVYNAERGPLDPQDLHGRKVGIRSHTVTTVMWLRGVLQNDYGVDLNAVDWITFEDAHVANVPDPLGTRRAAADKDPESMLMSGEIDAAVLTGATVDDRIRHLIPDPAEAARDWHQRNDAIQVNHMVAVKTEVAQAAPDLIREVYRLFCESKSRSGLPAPGTLDMNPIGVQANRRNLECAIAYCHQQGLISRRFEVEELLDGIEL